MRVGYLLKLKSTHVGSREPYSRRAFNRRWFVLLPTKGLHYFASATGADSTASAFNETVKYRIPCASIYDIEMMRPPRWASVSDAASAERTFVVHSLDSKTLVLRADTAADAREWVRALRRVTTTNANAN